MKKNLGVKKNEFHEIGLRNRSEPCTHLPRRFANPRMSAMAANLAEQGGQDKAAAQRAGVLALRRRMLGGDHPDTLSAAADLAASRAAQGRHDEAAVLREQVRAARTRALGAEHPLTLAAASDLALALVGQAKLAEAAVLLRAVLVARKRALGAVHPATLATAADLASVYAADGGIMLATAPHKPADPDRDPDVPEAKKQKARMNIIGYCQRRARSGLWRGGQGDERRHRCCV